MHLMNATPVSPQQLRKFRNKIRGLSPKELGALEQMPAFAEEYKGGLDI